MMKKRKRMSALLAGALMLFTVCPTAHAEEAPDLYYFGTADNGTLQQMQVLDDGGMLQGWVKNVDRHGNAQAPYKVCTYHDDALADAPEIRGDVMYLAVPQQDTLRFVLRRDLDQNEAEQKCREIAEQYFPGCEVFGRCKYYYDIFVQNEAQRTDEAAERLMQALADAHLIDAFYTWGGTADYMLIEHGFLTVYAPETFYWAAKEYDWAEIEAWVQEKHPECEFVRVTDEESALVETLGITNFKYLNWDPFYAVIPPEGTSFADHFALAVELHEQFDLDPFMWLTPLETEGTDSLVGRNALALAGDVNLDCSVDVSDAVLIARYLAEDKAAKIADQGLQNADADENGSVTPDDVTALLKYIARAE